MTGESQIINSALAASSVSFTTGNSDRVLVRVVPASGQTVTVTVSGTATSLESDTGTVLDTQTLVDSTGYLLSIEDTPVYKVTVAWSDLTAGTLSGYAWVGRV